MNGGVYVNQANEVLGFWKHDGIVPGTNMTSHNHCWNSVKVNGRWRLLDVFWAVEAKRNGFDIPFFISAEVYIRSPPCPRICLSNFLASRAYLSQPSKWLLFLPALPEDPPFSSIGPLVSQAFVYSHLPLEEWWQVLTTYITPEQFWEMPFCSLFFFTKVSPASAPAL